MTMLTRPAASLGVLALLLSGACDQPRPPRDPGPSNDPEQITDLTVEPMHNYETEARERIDEGNGQDELERIEHEVIQDGE